MARQGRDASNPLTPQKWLRKFMPYALEENVFARLNLMGSDDSNMIVVHKDLTKSVGKLVRMPMLGELTGVGGGDNFNSADIAEAYKSFYFDVPVHERGNTTILEGPMAAQHMIEDWSSEATSKLGRWLGRMQELELIRALSGLYNLSTDVESVNELAPSTGRIAYGGETAAGAIDTLSAFGDSTAIGAYSTGTKLTTDALLSNETPTDVLMGPNFLEKVVIEFMDSEPRPRLLTIGGVKCLLFIMTTKQAVAMKHNITYKNNNMYAQVRGDKNPLLSTSLGFWPCGETMVLLQSYGRMETRTGAAAQLAPEEGFTLNAGRTETSDPVASGETVGRGLLLGAGAGAIAYGSTKNGQLVERLNGDVDSGTGRKPLKGIETVMGVSKTVFKDKAGTAQEDYAVMAVDTCQQ